MTTRWAQQRSWRATISPSQRAVTVVGEADVRPGRNEVSRYPLQRSTMPLNSGSRGGASTILDARVPANAAAGAVTFPVPLIADSRSQTRVFVTLPIVAISCHIPDNRSPPWRGGSITADRNLEYANVITKTGNTRS
jgi:hypothetical protein